MEEENSLNICLGGTFSPLHRGHIRLLKEAFSRGKRVSVGLTSERMARSTRERTILPYEERLSGLKEVLDRLSKEHGVRYTVREISDRLGFAVREDMEAIVVSKERESTVDEIDKERIKRGLPPLRRFVVDMVLDDGGRRISSTRIAGGEIDVEGKRLFPGASNGENDACIHLGSKNRDKAEGAMRAFKRYWPEVRIFRYSVEDGDEHGGSRGPVYGAKRRVELMEKSIKRSAFSFRDHLVGIESGLVENEGVFFLVHCCYISSRDGDGFGMGPGLEIPPDMIENIMAYRGGTAWDTRDVLGERTSLIENMSGGSMPRDMLIEQACEMALLSLFNSLKKEDGI